MSYFNHAFQKVFIGTAGYHNTSGETTADLTTLKYGLYDAKTFEVTDGTDGKPFILASGSIYANDKIGPFHGGYTESNKSKVINPRYISKFYKVNAASSVQALTIVGKTDNEATDTCECPTFQCGRTYRLRIDIKGSPALRFLNHQMYYATDAYTGCCADPAVVTNVDPVTVMVQWALRILANPFLSKFIQPTVKYSLDNGSNWETPMTTVEQLEAYVAETDETAIAAICTGLELLGAYVDTQFGDCSFRPMDHFEKEPIQIYASFINDLNDPCQYDTLCATRAVLGKQGTGYGETIIRELILSEGYAQNYFKTDPRIREILQGNSVFTAANRTAKYDVYYLQHSVPRFNNPSGTFDNDQYLLKLVIDDNDTATAFETAIAAALTAANNPVTLETF